MPDLRPASTATRMAIGAGMPRQRGFTLLEFITVAVIAGILAAVSFSKLFSPGGLTVAHQAQAAADLVRRAQALSLTHGRQTRVSASSSSPSTTLLLEVCTSSSTCTTDASFATEQSVTLSGLAAPLRFNSLGQPIDSSGNLLSADAGFSLVVSSTEPIMSGEGAGQLQSVSYTYRVNVSALTGRVAAYKL